MTSWYKKRSATPSMAARCGSATVGHVWSHPPAPVASTCCCADGPCNLPSMAGQLARHLPLCVQRSTVSGELGGAAPGDAGQATSEPPGSYRSQQSSSDAESQSTAYTPAAASAPVGLAASSADSVAADGADGAAPKAADADSPLAAADGAGAAAAAAPPESPVPGLAVRRTTSTTRMNSVSGSEGGRWASVRLLMLASHTSD